MRRPGSPAPRKSGKNVIGRRLFEDEYEYRDAEYEKKHETMWCTEVAGGAFLTFSIVVSGNIADHGHSGARISTCN
jgi:hypothetical protein